MSYIGSKPANKPVVASDIDPTMITGQTALAVAPAATDEFLISDAGTLKRLDASLVGNGKVLQVVSAVSSTTVSTTSTSFASTGLTASITPSATSSKILVMATSSMYASADARATIFRDATDLSGTDSFVVFGGTDVYVSMIKLDSPSSTSSLTYEPKIKAVSTGTVYWENSDGTATLTLMEIGA